MNKDFKNIASYIKEIIEMRNRNIYNYNDYDFSFSLEQLYNNYNEFIEMKKDVSILTTGVFLKIKYISERHKKPYPQVPEILNKYISLYKNEVIGEMDNFEEELKLNHLYQTYIDYVNKIFYINEYNKKIESYNKLYSNIYSYNKRIKDNEEKLEFILATNLMSWKFDKTNCILRHIFEAFLNIDVDPINNTISFSVNHELKKGFVVDFLNQNNFQIKDKVELYKFIDNFDNQISEVVDINFNEIIRKFANLISYENNIPNKSFFNYKYSKLVDKHTYIFDDQHIIIRKKNSKIWVEDLEKILEAAETEELDATIFKLLNADFDNSEEVESILKSNEESETEAEVLFPLATNTEQFNIVNRVRGSNIVLVEGPPGTGKSHTIANLISHFISEGKKIIITSEKAKALEVVREKLPKDIRSLSLSLLSTSSSDKDLEFSVNQILKRQEEKENSDNIKNKISFLTNKLVDIRKEKASNTRQIIDLMMLDTVNHQDALKNVVSGEMKNYNLIEIAQWLEKHERYDLIPDEDNENIEFTNLVEMFSSLDSVVNNIQNENYDISKEIKLQSYLSDNTLKQLSIKVNDNNQYKPKTENLKDAIILNNLNEKIISELEKNLNELNTLTLGFSKNWILENTKYPVFIDILTQIMKDISELKSIIYIVEKNNLYYKIDYDFSNIDDYIKSLETIIKIIDNESKINIFQKAYFNRDIKIVKNIKIESQIKDCNILTHEVATVVFSKLIHDRTIHEIQIKLNNLFSKDVFSLLNINTNQFGKTVEKMEEYLNIFINYPDKVEKFDNILNNIVDQSLFKIGYYKVDSVKMNEIFLDLKYYATKDIYDQEINSIDDKIINDFNDYNLKYLNDLIISIRNTNEENIEKYKQKLLDEINIINKYNNIKLTYHNFFSQKSKFIYKYVFDYDDVKRKFVVSNIDKILKYHYVKKYYLLKESKVLKLPSLHNYKEQLESDEKKCIIKLIEVKGWYEQVNNMTPAISASLSRWIGFRTKYGKGTGKNANIYISEMQKEMQVSKNAIPVWIMTVEKLVEQYPFSNVPQFDVLIMDESSQTSILSISALARGKKIIIVGDDKQISPITVGQKIEQINDLKIKHLKNNKWSNYIDGNTSIYDIVKTVCGSKIISLTEHFRCLPEIINYSNKEFYRNTINPLKVRSLKNTIKKSILALYVPEATCKKVNNNPYNITEIEKIIHFINEIKNDEQYDGKTIGVIGLQNSVSHLQKILELIMSTFGEKFINERKIKVGTSYDFQGDERDVIILSMIVSSIDENGERYKFNPLVKKEFDRSFNVVASRAKEQMVLVHSVKIEELNPNCNRYKLLNYCLTYNKEKANEIEKLFESKFEKDVYYTLASNGINLTPQHKVGKYRLDFIIDNTNDLKIALECDGDRFHGINELSSDLERQAVLERCGWKFIRIRASEFYYNREESTNRIVEEIEHYSFSVTFHNNANSKEKNCKESFDEKKLKELPSEVLV